jgi:hypothetical protein
MIHPYIEFNQGLAMEVWYDEPTDSYTVTNPIRANETTIHNCIIQTKTIECAREKFKEFHDKYFIKQKP